MKISDIIDLRTAAATKRLHTMRMPAQTLAEHSYGVIMLIMCIDPNPSALLLQAAVVHDLPEYVTGDLPAPVKWESPALERELQKLESKWFQRFEAQYGMALTREEKMLLKLCDHLELAFYSIECLMQGNQYAEKVLLNILSAIFMRRYYHKLGASALTMVLLVLTEARKVSKHMQAQHYSTGTSSLHLWENHFKDWRQSHETV